MGAQVIDNTAIAKEAKQIAMDTALEIMGLKAVAYASAKCPVDTGRLRSSITHQQQGKDTEVIGTAVEYAPYQEFGTSKIDPHPFIKPAVQDHVDEYKAILEACMHRGG